MNLIKILWLTDDCHSQQLQLLIIIKKWNISHWFSCGVFLIFVFLTWTYK